MPQHSPTRIVSVPVLLHAGNLDEYGLPPYQLSNARGLDAVIRGVRTHPVRTRTLRIPAWADERWLSIRSRAEALQLRMPRAVVTHASAAELYGLVLPRRLTTGHLVHVTSPVSHVRREGFIGHRPKELETRREWGIVLARVDEALRQMCALLTDDELLMLVEGLCGPWREPAATTTAALAEISSGWPRFPGSRRLARVLERARDGVASPPETQLRLDIMAAGLPEPQVNAEIWANGRRYHPDLSYREQRIALEYEGDHHRTDPDQWEHDIRREADCRSAGWEYIRVTKRSDTALVLGALRTALRTRGHPALMSQSSLVSQSSPMSQSTSPAREKTDAD